MNCTGFTRVTVGTGVTKMDEYAFYGCVNLTGVYISDMAKWCGISFVDNFSNPLNYAKNLYLNEKLVTDLVIPDGVTRIGNYAFTNCDGITSVTIPDGVTSIGKNAFHWCTGLTSVYYKGTASEWESVTVGEQNSPIDKATRYYYSETVPTETGNYWHYDENGAIVVW